MIYYFRLFPAIICYAIKAFATLNVIHEALNKEIYVTSICLEKTLRTGMCCTKGTNGGASSISSLNENSKISLKSLVISGHWLIGQQPTYSRSCPSKLEIYTLFNYTPVINSDYARQSDFLCAIAMRSNLSATLLLEP